MLCEPKAGSTESEYEDAWSVPRGPASAGDGYTVAVADGASESMLAGAWARILVQQVGRSAGRDLDAAGFAALVCDAAGQWPKYLGRYIRARERAGRPVAWYEEPKLERGAYATLLGVSFRREEESESGSDHSGGGTWTGAALGDSCAFQVRRGRLVSAFPLEAADQFDTSPNLAGSRDPDPELVELRTVVRHGTWLPGDVFYLATDAAAQWFLAEVEAGLCPWMDIDEVIGGCGALDNCAAPTSRAWLEGLRADRRIRNDDVTIVRCRLEPP